MWGLITGGGGGGGNGGNNNNTNNNKNISPNKTTPNNPKLQQERLQQEQLIKEQLKALELDNELQRGQITQKGLIAKQHNEQVLKQKKQLEEEKQAEDMKKNAQNQRDAARRQDSGDSTASSQSTRSKLSQNLEMARKGYEQLVNAIIRPPRAQYQMKHLGPTDFTFLGTRFVRHDMECMTERGYTIQCSHWIPHDLPNNKEDHHNVPVVVYMHGNASARVEVLPQLSFLLSLGVTVFSLDFTGSGMSDGDYVSLGYYEREDLTCVVAHLRANGYTNIALWGRSMGAATALMYGDRDPAIACMILDSSFASLVQLAEEMVEKARQQGVIVPNVIVSVAIQMISYSIRKKAQFTMADISPIAHAPNITIPALFVAGEHDDFIQKHHSENLCQTYKGQTNLLLVEGDHNDQRPEVMYYASSYFLQRHLNLSSQDQGLPVPDGLNLQCPPWSHARNKAVFQAHSYDPITTTDSNYAISTTTNNTTTTETAAPPDTTLNGAAPVATDTTTSMEDMVVDELNVATDMGMTKERQNEIQSSLNQMLVGGKEPPTPPSS